MKRLLLILTGICAIGMVQAQDEFENFGMGLIEDNDAYAQIPRKQELLTRDYIILPESYSLQKYCPKAGSQGRFGTCSAWSTTYAALTIAEAIKWGWTDAEVITDEAFAPMFVYSQVKNEADNTCTQGATIKRAMELLKVKGAPKHRNFNYTCEDFVPRWVSDEAADNTIDDFFTLFDSNCISQDKKVNAVKKSLTQERPVLINMHVPMPSFGKAGDVWNGSTPEDNRTGYHAMCVVAYDDNKAGGAFQIMNSWGERWGNKGFTWVKYADFAKYVDWAFELYVNKIKYPEVITYTRPIQTPKRQEETITVFVDPEKPANVLSGSMYIQLRTGEQMEQKLVKGKWPTYEVKGKYLTGTRYRIYLTNDAPAYVYVIGSDLQNHVSKVFPPEDNISPALVYSSNNIALPGEDYWAEMDDTRGKDYLCVLYASRALPIDDIIGRIRRAEGAFAEKLVQALEAYGLVPIDDISYEREQIAFKATTHGIVVPMIVEITHK